MPKEVVTAPAEKSLIPKPPDSIQESFGPTTGRGGILHYQRVLGNRKVAELIRSRQISPHGKLVPIQPRLREQNAEEPAKHEAVGSTGQIATVPGSLPEPAAKEIGARKAASVLTPPYPMESATPGVAEESESSELDADKRELSRDGSSPATHLNAAPDSAKDLDIRPEVAAPPGSTPDPLQAPTAPTELALSAKPAATGVPDVQRLSLDDIIPDFILNPIKQLVSGVSDFANGVTSKSNKVNSASQSDADSAAAKVDTETGATLSGEQSKAESAAGGAQTQTAKAAATAESAKATGESKAGEMQSALPLAEHASDPVKSVTQPPPESKLPGGEKVPAKAAADSWNCDEASILKEISSVETTVIDGLTKAVKAVVPESVLSFAQQGIARLQSAVGTIKQKVEAAKAAVSQWVDTQLKPVRDFVENAEKFASAKIDAAKRAISNKLSELGTWASSKWTALKTGVSSAVNDAISWAKHGVGGFVDRAKDLAGRFWNMLPDWLKRPLTGAAEALAAPVALAMQGVRAAATWIETKSAWVKSKLAAAADTATKFFAEKYQQIRGFVVKVKDGISSGITWVKNKATALGHAVYDKLDKLSGGRISKWRAAAAKKLAELKGDVCAVAGAVAGPCVERFVPEPVGPNGKSFASLVTKADVTVPIEGVPVKVKAGATIKIERTSRKYNAVLTGEGFVGVGLPKKSDGADAKGGGSDGASGTLSVDGTFSQKLLAMTALGSSAPAVPAVPVPIGPKTAPGGAQAPVPQASGRLPGSGLQAAGGARQAAAPTTQAPQAAQAPGGGGGASIDAEAGEKATVSLTYTFDATADKSTCDGLGGLTAFIATQGAAALLPAPFSTLAAAGGQAAFADKLTSAKVTVAQTGSVSIKGGAGGADVSLGASAQSGASLEAKNDEKGKTLTATLFQSLSGEGAVSFAPEKIGLIKISAALEGRQELAIVYNLTLDTTDATFKQALTGSCTLEAFAGIAGSLPAAVRDQVKRLLVCLPSAQGATVSFELSNNLANLHELAAAIDTELNKGSAASATGVWDAVSTYLKNADNSFIQFSAKLNLSEKVLGVKAGGSADGVSGGVDVSVNRGQEIVLCPPVKLQGGVAQSIGTISSAAIPDNPRLCDDDELTKKFGNSHRDLNLDPDNDPTTTPRVDDVPIFESFRKIYNRLDSWSIFIQTNNPELTSEFATTYQLEEKRKEWLEQVKQGATDYKARFRNLSNTDPEKARQEYEDLVLGDIQKQIDALNRAIAAWYRDKTGSTESIEEIIERVHAGGTELWRDAWKAAILKVNGVLAETWPTGKAAILDWLGQQRVRLPHVDLSGAVGELDYIGSLATGYKGPPKQQIRFNPEKFDVDANLPAPPLAKYALAIDSSKPDRKRIFGRNTSITPLKQFSDRTHSELKDRVKGYDVSEPFDVAIDAPELPTQEFSRLATERLYRLRTSLPAEEYTAMIGELRAGGYLDPKGVLPDDVSEAQSKEINAIMDRYQSVTAQ